MTKHNSVSRNELSSVEKRVLGALLMLSNSSNVATVTLNDIAKEMGYKKSGGILTYALRLLEKDNYIVRMSKNKIKILV